MVEYLYDSWGRIIATTGSLATTLGANQPFRYRGYVYDEETGWYYLQSRYYDPTTCRFISADVLLSTGQGVIGHNSFAYCINNAINLWDPEGNMGGCFDWISNSKDGSGRGFGCGYGSGFVRRDYTVNGNYDTTLNSNNEFGSYKTFESNEALESHFSIHGKEFEGLFTTPEEYLDGANYVLQNGTYVPENNGYVRFFGAGGGANYAFVGLKGKGNCFISTFSVRSDAIFGEYLWLK